MKVSSIRDWIQGQNLIEKGKSQTDPEKYFPVKPRQVSNNITVETELVAAAPIKFWQNFGPKFTKQKLCFTKALIWGRLL